MTLVILCLTIILSSGRLFAETVRSKIKGGISHYNHQEYDQALKSFIDAQIEAPEDAKLSYNIGNAYYKMKNYDEAVKSFLNSAAKAKDLSLEEKSYYNLGNSFYRQGKLQEALSYYQKALELDPEDNDAKQNLEFVREEIKRHINEEKKRPQQESSKNQNNQQEQQGQKEKSPAGQEQKQQKQDDKSQAAHGARHDKHDGQDKQNGEEQPQAVKNKVDKNQGATKSAPKPKTQAAQEMSEEEAQRWLNSLSEDKKDFLKQQMKAQAGEGYNVEKDW